MAYLLMVILLLTAVFLILLVLIQRGKGGGLAGAFGGMGGQSAFGTKAGDLFTKVTIVVAACWIILCLFSVHYYGSGNEVLAPDLGGQGQTREGVTAPSQGAEPSSETAQPTVPSAPKQDGK